ncbi:MAG: DNA translocase FtsK 4TM domain-containing protein, partial [Alphaproteobacteria bacterium]|nr:DNA translocase FtsK 4TM domain-containing protein [Alphaproteobacteria bacterium]
MSSKYVDMFKEFLRDVYERFVELIGILLFFIALASILALVSYCSEDPSLNTAIDGAVSNMMSTPGSYYSDFM